MSDTRDEVREALTEISKAEQAEAYSGVAMTTADYLALVRALRKCGDIARAALSRLSAQPEPPKDARELAQQIYRTCVWSLGEDNFVEQAAPILARLSASGQGEGSCQLCVDWDESLHTCARSNAQSSLGHHNNECGPDRIYFQPAAPAPEKGETKE